jgi:hypothetical protein
MRLRLRCGLVLPVTLLAAVACGGDDLVLPSNGSPAGPTPTQLQMAGGNGQIGVAGSPLPNPVRVQLLDESGNGMVDQAVTWVVGTGDGSATPQSTTDANGFAEATWTLGTPGSNTLNAVVSGLGHVTFTATANDPDDNGGDNGGGNHGGGGSGTGTIPSPAASTVSADPSSIQATSGVSTIRVTVRDDGGLPVAGAVVRLTASGSGNTLTQPQQPTSSDGVAVGTLKSDVAGTKDIMASVNGTTQITQTAQIFVTPAGPPPPPATAEPDHFVYQVGPQDVNEKEWFTVRVAIVDASGNVVPLNGTQIYIGLVPVGQDTPVNAYLRGDRFVDTQNGVAEFTLAVDKKGTYRLRARSDYMPKNLGPFGPELFSNTFEVQ